MGLLDIIKKEYRDFVVCSDCYYFNFDHYLVDKKYGIKCGFCKLNDQPVDDRYEVNCENFDDSSEHYCSSCIYFSDCSCFDQDELDAIKAESSDFYCEWHDEVIDEDNTICSDFHERDKRD